MRKIFIFLYKIKILKRIVPSTLKVLIKLFKQSRVKIITQNNLLFNLNLKNPIDREIYLKDSYEKKQINYLQKIIKINKIDYFIDVGAHMGFYSVIMSRNNIPIFSFEPITNNYLQLKENIKLNKIKDIKLFNIALSEKKENIIMWVPNKEKTGGFSVHSERDEELLKYDNNKIYKEISKSDLGDNILKINKSKIVIKIDVERHEQEVLNGMSKLLKNNKIIIQMEIFKKIKKNILKLMTRLNFKHINTIKKDYYFKNYE